MDRNKGNAGIFFDIYAFPYLHIEVYYDSQPSAYMLSFHVADAKIKCLHFR